MADYNLVYRANKLVFEEVERAENSGTFCQNCRGDGYTVRIGAYSANFGHGTSPSMGNGCGCSLLRFSFKFFEID